ncbi:MAG: hypothetical protein D3906_14990, partial [Candidatus Electrothrix sp. AUS1_2]|nr:hypothetical protein [Candidatus Electrothrix sp. AUS1_2]
IDEIRLFARFAGCHHGDIGLGHINNRHCRNLGQAIPFFQTDTKGTDEHEIFQIDPWKVVSNAESGLIPPKGYRDIVYTILYPPGEGHELDVHAKLRFRQASQKVAEKLLTNLPKGVSLEKWYGLTEIPAVPIVDMTETNVTMMTTGEPSKEPNLIDKLTTGWSHTDSLKEKKK